MKLIQTVSRFFLLVLSFCFSLTVVAQEKSAEVDVNINKGGGNWYAQPWVWIVGGALFILLLVALLRGGGRRD